ncbi:MAG: hypothetical protein SGJ09_03385 [Phycisphaerae bacterium]|nr:hypothetical protein [Phycisphaerae bacterium]
MAIRTSIQPRHLYLKPLYALVCLGFGVWGWYDFSVKIPRDQAAFAEFSALKARTEELASKRTSGGTLSAEDVAEYETKSALLTAKYKEPPIEPASYNRAVQLWLYVIGCGILGTPMFVWPLIKMARRHYEVDDDGVLHVPEGTCKLDDVVSIDMSRWMSKSMATITLPSGATSVLDDYAYKNLHLIVGAIAHRIYPDDWTVDARDARKEAAKAAEKAEREADNSTDSTQASA